VVTAAVTDAWEAARKGFARLLGRGDPDKAKVAERRLEEAHSQLAEAKGSELELVRAALAAGLVAAADHAVAAGRDMKISASGLMRFSKGRARLEMAEASRAGTLGILIIIWRNSIERHWRLRTGGSCAGYGARS
jgi:hypothetical protein